VRSYDLREGARYVYQTLDPVRRAVAAVIAAMLDERVPLVGPTDFSSRMSQVMPVNVSFSAMAGRR
jgi:hypothetical protein